jgi:putative hydrolase of the HAD superfamily
MEARAFDLIAFDGDDTLWHNERSYRDGRERFRILLAGAGIDLSDETVDACVNRTELANLEYFGYGVSSFALSLIETAIDLTGGRITGTDLQEVIALARQMLTEEIELFAGARDALAALSSIYPLMLVTKGDLLHQTSKLERSGLRPYFNFVEVVSHKTEAAYTAILNRQGVDPHRFLMVGNSLKSDVLPVLKVGGKAVHIPAALSWSHEHAEPPDDREGRYFELQTLGELAQLVETIEHASRVSAGDSSVI